MYRIFMIEDDEGILNAVRKCCEKWEMEVSGVENYREILAEFVKRQPHLVIMDNGLPAFDGYHWCREIRRISNVPILFLSSAADNMNQIMAMSMGGDDFIAKPFDMEVLIAKLQALLRRTYDFAQPASLLGCGGAVLDTAAAELAWQGQKIPLTKNENRILQVLLEHKGKVVERDTLMTRLWETDSYVDENTLTVNVARLRKKLEAAGLRDFIQTQKGVGYKVGGTV